MTDAGVEEDKQVPYSSFLHARRIVTCNLFLPQLQLAAVWKLFSQVSIAALDVNVLCILSETPPPQEPFSTKQSQWEEGCVILTVSTSRWQIPKYTSTMSTERPQSYSLECSTSGWIAKV